MVRKAGLCTACVNYMNTYRETIRIGKLACREPEGPVPADVPEELVAVILDARSSGGPG